MIFFLIEDEFGKSLLLLTWYCISRSRRFSSVAVIPVYCVDLLSVRRRCEEEGGYHAFLKRTKGSDNLIINKGRTIKRGIVMTRWLLRAQQSLHCNLQTNCSRQFSLQVFTQPNNCYKTTAPVKRDCGHAYFLQPLCLISSCLPFTFPHSLSAHGWQNKGTGWSNQGCIERSW